MSAQNRFWILAERSEMGYVREENQDRMLADKVPLGNLYVVADGMGGHKGGALAASMTVMGLREQLADIPADVSDEEAIKAAFASTNKAVYDRAHGGDPETEGMGSTAVLLLATEKAVRVAHAGDSRAYLCRGGRLRRLTTDHTVVQRLLRIGALSAREARDHPDVSVLDRAMGHLPEIDVEISPLLAVQSRDAFLLCTDGLSGAASDREIEEAIGGAASAREVADRLIELSLEKGGEDNVTVQFIRYRGSAEEPSGNTRRSTREQPVEPEAGQALGSVSAPSRDTTIRRAESLRPPFNGWGLRMWVLALTLALIALLVASRWLGKTDLWPDRLWGGSKTEQAVPDVPTSLSGGATTGEVDGAESNEIGRPNARAIGKRTTTVQEDGPMGVQRANDDEESAVPAASE